MVWSELPQEWTKDLADSIHQLKDVRFINQMNVWTTFDRDDFARILVEDFRVARDQMKPFTTTCAR